MKRILAAIALAAIATHVCAQEAAPAQPPPAPSTAPSAEQPPAAPVCCVIPAGTPVVIELVNEISSNGVVRGDMFPLRLVEPVEIDGHVLMPRGARGMGEVIDAAKAGMGGKPGELLVAARYIKVGDVQVPIRGMKLSGHGENNSKDAQTAVLIVGVGGMFIRGGDLVMPAGSRASAKVARDTPLPPPAATPAPNSPAEPKPASQP